jgi:hypothetical protein
VQTTVPVSHRLHYLQMWLEKLCKAYLWLPGANAVELRTRHQVVGNVLPRLMKGFTERVQFQGSAWNGGDSAWRFYVNFGVQFHGLPPRSRTAICLAPTAGHESTESFRKRPRSSTSSERMISWRRTLLFTLSGQVNVSLKKSVSCASGTRRCLYRLCRWDEDVDDACRSPTRRCGWAGALIAAGPLAPAAERQYRWEEKKKEDSQGAGEPGRENWDSSFD